MFARRCSYYPCIATTTFRSHSTQTSSASAGRGRLFHFCWKSKLEYLPFGDPGNASIIGLDQRRTMCILVLSAMYIELTCGACPTPGSRPFSGCVRLFGNAPQSTLAPAHNCRGIPTNVPTGSRKASLAIIPSLHLLDLPRRRLIGTGILLAACELHNRFRFN